MNELTKLDDLRLTYNEIVYGLNKIKKICREVNPNLYKRWKAGGFIVDDTIVSMYPNLEEVINFLSSDLEDELIVPRQP